MVLLSFLLKLLTFCPMYAHALPLVLVQEKSNRNGNRNRQVMADCGSGPQRIHCHISDGQGAEFNVGFGVSSSNGCRSACSLKQTPNRVYQPSVAS